MTRSAVDLFQALALALGLCCSLVPRAAACFVVEIPPYAIDSSLREIDTTPPTPFGDVSVLGVRIAATHCEGDYCTETSCPDWGGLRIKFSPPRDDHTPSDELGYRVVWKGSPLPSGMSQVIDRVWPLGTASQLSIEVGFDAVADLDGSIELIAVDRAGNESAPSATAPVKVLGCTTYFDQPTCDEEHVESGTEQPVATCAVAQPVGPARGSRLGWLLPLMAAGVWRFIRRGKLRAASQLR